MQTTSIDKIVIPPNRQRQDFEPQALMELTTSIATNGLLHAPVLRELDGQLLLVAGERRLRALKDLWALGNQLTYNCQLIPEGQVPYITLGQLNHLEAEEAELDENLHRRNLTWQEHASAVQRLHELRKAQAESRGAIQTIAATAEEVLGRGDGAYQAQVRTETIVAKHLDDPDVAGAKTLKEGFKILKRKEELKQHALHATEVGKTFSAKDHQIFNEDCISWMLAYDGPLFDVICSDPPYGMGADSFGDGAGGRTGIEHHYDDSYESWQQLMRDFLPLSAKVTKAEAHMYLWCDFDRFHELKKLATESGWYVFRTPLIVVKTGNGRVPLPEHGPRRQYEICLYAIKGNKVTIHIYPDVITCGPDPNDGHGATKPVALITNLLQRSVRPGDTVLDPFAGSGSVFPAAHLMKCACTGIEQSKEYYGMCLGRLEKLEELC